MSMMRRTLAVTVGVGLVVAVAAACSSTTPTALEEPPTAQTSSSAVTSPAVQATAEVTMPTYLVTSATGGPITTTTITHVQLVERVAVAMYARDYTLAHPGFSTATLRSLTTGQAREAAEAVIKAAPTPAEYAGIQKDGGWTKTVTVLDATVSEYIVMVLHTTDSHGAVGEVNIRAQVGPCDNNLCVTHFEPFSTE